MTPRRRGRPYRVRLISTPWALADRPSLPLALLTPALRLPGVQVEAASLQLEVAARFGVADYARIAAGQNAEDAPAERTGWGEALYAWLLFPSQREAIRRRWEPHVGRRLADDAARLRDASAAAFDAALAEPVDLAGFSVSFPQICAALWFARRLRLRAPDTRIVWGGFHCTGEMGRGLLAAFPEIDFVVSGEGEPPLRALVRSLARGGSDPGDVPGVARRLGKRIVWKENDRPPPLDSLPPPDWDEYFARAARWAAAGVSLGNEPTVAVQGSRGCPWGRCRFCAHALVSPGYRWKSAARLAGEMRRAARRHGVRHFLVVDSVLAPTGVEALRQLARESPGARVDHLFLRRPSTALLRALPRGLVRRINVGIEALGTGLLRKMNRGSTALENVRVLRDCEELGLEVSYQLLTGHPGEDAEDLREERRLIPFLVGLRPPRGVVRYMHLYGSPLQLDPERYGVRPELEPPAWYRVLFPPRRAARLVPAAFEHRLRRPAGGDPAARLRRVARWRTDYERGAALTAVATPGGGLRLEDRRGTPARRWRLGGRWAALYEALFAIRSRAELARRFPELPAGRLDARLREWEHRRLVLREDDRWLALAVRRAAGRAGDASTGRRGA